MAVVDHTQSEQTSRVDGGCSIDGSHHSSPLVIIHVRKAKEVRGMLLLLNVRPVPPGLLYSYG